MSEQTALVLLVAATWLHLGFQGTVSALVYPVLAATPAASWAPAHDRHSRVITPLVGFVYGALLVGAGTSLVLAPGPAVVVSVAAVGLSLGTTALVAAPLHGRLAGGGPTPERLRLLLVADRWRAAGAVLAAGAAALAWLTR